MGNNTSNVLHEHRAAPLDVANHIADPNVEDDRSDDDADWVQLHVEEYSCLEAMEARVAVAGAELSTGTVLDEEAFPCFAPLLSASQAYANHTGCRFRSSDFCDLPAEDSAAVIQLLHMNASTAAADQSREAVALCHLAAKLQAAPMVACFANRMRLGELELLEELTSAYDVVMGESVRSAMVASFRELGLWPPSPAPEGIEASDYNFEDLAAPIPVIAQRAFNDEAGRGSGSTLGAQRGLGRASRRATTASYLVDFVQQTGVHVPTASVSSRYACLLKTFNERVEQWKNESASLSLATVRCNSSRECNKRIGFCVGSSVAGAGVTVDDCGMEVATRWSECWRDALWACTGTICLNNTAASVGIKLLRRSVRNEMKNSKAT